VLAELFTQVTLDVARGGGSPSRSTQFAPRVTYESNKALSGPSASDEWTFKRTESVFLGSGGVSLRCLDELAEGFMGTTRVMPFDPTATGYAAVRAWAGQTGPQCVAQDLRRAVVMQAHVTQVVMSRVLAFFCSAESLLLGLASLPTGANMCVCVQCLCVIIYLPSIMSHSVSLPIHSHAQGR
jgi:hypothetical protein